MGKGKIFVNGKLMTEYFGGYLQILVGVTNVLKWGQDVIIVWDNDNDSTKETGNA